MPTPIYDAVREYAAAGPLRLHMPGHRGGAVPGVPELERAAALDLTEIGPTGDLYAPGPPFDQGQALWARQLGFDQCQLLTGGSTQAIHTGLALCARPGERVLVDRNCHRAVFNIMALLDLEPVYLPRPWLEEEGLIGPISPEDVGNFLKNAPDIKTVCITSPTYAGVLSDVAAISQVVQSHGAKLFVDGAHGAHLSFLGLHPFEGVDAVAMSAHKTLPALGQGALLAVNGFQPGRVRQLASVFGTSSPSYLVLASMDAARDWLEGEGRREYQAVADKVAALRGRYPALGGELALDPTRLTLKVQDGPAFARALEERGIFPEMEDGGHVVLICTPRAGDQEGTRADFCRLEGALDQLRPMMGPCPPIPAPPMPRRVLSMRQALFGQSRPLPLKDCLGRVAASQIAPYPPGVPVVAPGEEIGKKELSYLSEIGYNICSEIRVTC